MNILWCLLCGFILGAERELKHKEAGLKILVFISLGAFIFTRIGQLAGCQERVIAQIISGIGFIGSGTIVFNQDKLSGLSSAAMIWLCAAIGIMNAIDLCKEAIILSVGVVVIGAVIDKIRPYLGRIS